MDIRTLATAHYTVVSARQTLDQGGVRYGRNDKKPTLINLLLDNPHLIPQAVRYAAIPRIVLATETRASPAASQPPAGLAGIVGTLATRMSTMEETVRNTLLTLQDSMEELRTGNRGETRGVLPEGFAPPPRGETLLPPIEERFAHVRPSSLVQDAINGQFPHEKLYALLDHNSLLGAPAVKAATKAFQLDADGRITATTDEETRDEAISKFVKAFPTAELFTVAWCALCDLTIHSIGDPVLVADTVAAFHWHASFMIEYSKSYEWSGLLRYHFSVAATRSKHGLVPQSWYRQVDQIVFNAVVRPLPPRATSSAAPRTAAASTSRAPSGPPPAGNSDQFCMNYAAGRCTGPTCPFNRVHLCRFCRAAHTKKDCPAMNTGGVMGKPA